MGLHARHPAQQTPGQDEESEDFGATSPAMHLQAGHTRGRQAVRTWPRTSQLMRRERGVGKRRRASGAQKAAIICDLQRSRAQRMEEPRLEAGKNSASLLGCV